MVSWSLSPPSKHRPNHCWVTHTQFHRASPRTRGARKPSTFDNGASSQYHQPLTRLIWLFLKRPSCVLIAPSRIRPRGDSPFSWPRSAARHGQSFPAEPLDPTKCGPPPDRDPPLFSGRLLFPQWNSLYHSTKIRVSLQRCQFLLPERC